MVGLKPEWTGRIQTMWMLLIISDSIYMQMEPLKWCSGSLENCLFINPTYICVGKNKSFMDLKLVCKWKCNHTAYLIVICRSWYFSQYSDLAMSWTAGVWFLTGAMKGPTLGPTVSYLVGTRDSFTGTNRLGCEVDHSPTSSAEVKNAWSYTSTPPYIFKMWF
jgi:hypothetical protein